MTPSTPFYRRSFVALTLTLAFTFGTAAAAPTSTDAVRYFEGKAFALSDGHVMYLESHWLYEDHGDPSRLVLYRCPNGKPFARKTVHDDGSSTAPDFELDDARTGYREGIRQVNRKRVVFVRDQTGARERSAIVKTSPNLVIDAGFDAYIRDHWKALGAKGSAEIRFLVPSRLKTMKFSVKRMADTRVNGRAARQFRLGLASWFGFALPHIEVAYDTRSRELLRFVGLANIRGNHGDNVRARITFDPALKKNVSQAALAKAEQEPLDGRCPIP